MMPSSPPATTYGTLPTAPTTNPTRIQPWRTFLDPTTLTLPDTYTEALTRTRHNLTRFTRNYTILLLAILFLSLIYHPLSMLAFIALSFIWHFAYFSQVGIGKVPIFGRLIEERFLLWGLWAGTVVGLVFTGVGVNVLVGLCVGVAVVGLHSALRGVGDLGGGDDDGLRSGDC